MKERVQGTLTAGVAIVGAGVVAMTPIAPPPPVIRASDVSIDLMASPIETLAGGIGQSVLNLGSGLVNIRLGLIPITQAIGNANGSTNTALYLALQAYIDGPLYDLDPTLAA